MRNCRCQKITISIRFYCHWNSFDLLPHFLRSPHTIFYGIWRIYCEFVAICSWFIRSEEPKYRFICCNNIVRMKWGYIFDNTGTVKVAGTTVCDNNPSVETPILGKFNGRNWVRFTSAICTVAASVDLFAMDGTEKLMDDHRSSPDDESGYISRGATLVSSTVSEDLISLNIVSLIGENNVLHKIDGQLFAFNCSITKWTQYQRIVSMRIFWVCAPMTKTPNLLTTFWLVNAN